MTTTIERQRLAVKRKLAQLCLAIGICTVLLGITILALLWPLLKVLAVIKYLLS